MFGYLKSVSDLYQICCLDNLTKIAFGCVNYKNRF